LDHKELDVWKASIDFVLHLYEMTKRFPKEERYSLSSQIRRAAVSVSSNIAEGAARNSDKEFIQFLYIALGSLAELETQIIIAQRLGYLTQSANLLDKASSIKQMLLGLIKYLKGKGIKRRGV
jgi:four helix bundle protein